MHNAATLLAVEPSSRPASTDRKERLLGRFRALRDFTTRLCRNLQPEDCVVQSMPDVSPTKWHLAHTTWFFETFVVKQWVTGYESEVPEYAFLFNSYYNAAGTMHRRDLRGLISRPTLQETKRYRASIDEQVAQLIESADEKLLDQIEPVLILGFHHEQQHQELLVTDIKHVFAQNPLHPVFENVAQVSNLLSGDRGGSKMETCATVPPLQFIEFDEAIVEIGHAGSEFSYDNEGPRHRALVGPFGLANRLVTNGEYLAFMHDRGYQRPEFWLSLGWTAVHEQRWQAPLYWEQHDGAWWNFTLSGFREVNEDEPVTHVSQFEADAYANWNGARLPTEFEWERASASLPLEGNFVDEGNFHPVPVSSSSMPKLAQMFGDVWEWTRSAYLPYPGYRAAAGALGEYNGKFMSSQIVLRGGSCATTRNHLRATYRNFFPPDKRWQFSGLRLARDLA
ncbi:MAG: ergothioneine biosynthesis protein EgtB [Chthoniobacterales bacterium]